MKRLYILLLGALLLTGCSKKVLFDEQHDFANHTWNRFTPEVFNIDVDNVEDYYNIDLTIAVDTLLNEGSHRLEIGQATSKYDLRGMVSLNAYVERAKLDYDDL